MKTPSQSGAETKERLFSKDYVLVMLSATGTSFMNFFFAAVIAIYIDKIGGLQIHAGLMSTFYSLASLVSRAKIGALSDKFGRVNFLIAGTLICAAMSVMFGLIAAIPALLIIRTVKGVGFSMQSTCAGAVAADVLPKFRLNEGIGYFAMHSTVAQAAGPGIALAIVAGETIADYRLLFFISAGLCLMSVAASVCITYERKRKALTRQQVPPPPSRREAQRSGFVSERRSDEAERMPAERRAQHSEVRNDDDAPLPKTFLGFEHAAYPVIAVLVLLYFGIVAFMLFIPPFARWREFGNPWLFFVVSAVGVFVARMIFGRVADRRGADIVIIPWLVVLAACIFLIPFTGSAAVFIALGFPLGFAQGAVTPTFNAMLFQRCSPTRRGGASGAFFASIDAGFAIGAPVLGALADARDFGYIFWAGAIFVMLSLGLYLLIASDKRYNAKRKSA